MEALERSEDTAKVMDAWWVPASGIRESLDMIHKNYPEGFVISGPDAFDDAFDMNRTERRSYMMQEAKKTAGLKRLTQRERQQSEVHNSNNLNRELSNPDQGQADSPKSQSTVRSQQSQNGGFTARAMKSKQAKRGQDSTIDSMGFASLELKAHIPTVEQISEDVED